MAHSDVRETELGADLLPSSRLEGSIRDESRRAAEALLLDVDVEFPLDPAMDGFENNYSAIHPDRWFDVFPGWPEPAPRFGMRRFGSERGVVG